MENTPTGHADDLPTILGFFKNDPKSISVNIFVQRLAFAPNSIKDFIYKPKLRPAMQRVVSQRAPHPRDIWDIRLGSR